MSALWGIGTLPTVIIPLLLMAALVLSTLAWFLPAPPPAPAAHAAHGTRNVNLSLPLLFAGISALLIVVALVLVHLRADDGPRPAPAITALTVILVIALATIGGGPFTTSILALAMRSSAGPHGGIVVGTTETPSPSSAPDVSASRGTEVLRGGTTIGLLERAGAAGAIVAGFPEAIAVIVALKGVGRFTELTSPEAKERFIIGSIASLLWACGCALLVR